MFNVGDQVYLCADKLQIGIVTVVLPAIGGTRRYQVFHNAASIGTYYENQLERMNSPLSATNVTSSDFLGFYAARKTQLNADSSLYALNSGKIKFIPFQFRPLAKVINADVPRILIADEVGVGKTIETGIILKEFEKRENISSVIIVCPKDLTSKWRSEMKMRFDEAFEVLTSSRLNYCIEELKLEGVWPYECRKCIIGLEAIRREENIKQLIAIDDIAKFDMFVLDEAHHVINPNGNSHRIVEYFCENSNIAVFLSATPLQLGSHDLYSLLNLLNPSEFMDRAVFDLMVEPNKFINNAIRKIRSASTENWQVDAAEELKKVCVNEWATSVFKNNRQLRYWIEQLQKSDVSLSNEARICCLRDLDSLHTLSHVINRTKRKDIGEFTIREPITICVAYCKSEQLFYDAVKSFKTGVLLLRYGSLIANLIMSTIERQITSCIPAFVTLLGEFIEKGLFSLAEITDDYFDDESTIFALDEDGLREQSIHLQELACELPEKDCKTEKLMEIIAETTTHTADGKLLVFSFFKHTLRYLLGRVQLAGVRVEMITGDTKAELRDTLRRRFRLPKEDKNAIDVLLCSEVGCEGLDYEFCSRMVNYDIPWNPMKIEQRIGRIDRFGQKSPKIQIFNFITAGTIEERVFFRCYERLGIFSATIGDLEGVLGDIASDLTQAAFNVNLTTEQLTQRTNQLADNAIRLAVEQRKFENDSKELFLMDIEQNDESIKVEKNIQIRFNQAIVQMFFTSCFPTVQCTRSGGSQMKLRLFKPEKQSLLEQLIQLKRRRRVDKNSRQVQLFEDYLMSETQTVALCFDGMEEEADTLFITLAHPLLLLALDQIRIGGSAITTSIKVHSKEIPSGRYLFACYEWHEIGYRNSEDVKVVMYSQSTGAQQPITLAKFEALLLMAEDSAGNVNEALLPPLDKIMLAEQQQAKLRLSELNDAIISRKLSTIHRYYSNLLAHAEYDLNNAKNEKIRTMYAARCNRQKAIWQEKKNELSRMKMADITVKQFAYGTMEVE